MKGTIKTIVAAAMIVVICLTAVGCSKGAGSDAKNKYGSGTMKLFIPGEYMSDTLIPDFEKKFGVKVIVEYFDSNEMMYTKLQAGDSYDVLVPSDYMIERLLKEDLLQPIDKSVITNMNLLAPQVLNQPYDAENKYSIPYFWGTVGIVYDTHTVALEDLEEKGFDIFRDPRYVGDIYLYDSERDSFMMAFKQLGYSCNTDNEEEINAAYEWLLDISENMKPDFVTDEIIDNMMNGSKSLGVVYSGDAVTILDENEDMSYFTPNCGTNVWFDAMVIPKNAENPALANEFINYVITYEAALGNTDAVGYTSVNKQVLDELTAEGGSMAENVAYLPRTYEKDEVFHDNEFLRKKLSELWLKVKASAE